MNTIQQVPAAKILVVETTNHDRYVLCYSASMGYYIAEAVKAEDIVICSNHRANRMIESMSASEALMYVDKGGQEYMTPIYDVSAMEMSMLIKDEVNQMQNPHNKLGRYTFVNREGNFIRWNVQFGYHIDPNSNAVIYSVEKETDAVLMCLRFNGMNQLLKNTAGEIVDSRITIFSQE